MLSGSAARVLKAEREGFKPPKRTSRFPDFESGPFGHSGISPKRGRGLLLGSRLRSAKLATIIGMSNRQLDLYRGNRKSPASKRKSFTEGRNETSEERNQSSEEFFRSSVDNQKAPPRNCPISFNIDVDEPNLYHASDLGAWLDRGDGKEFSCTFVLHYAIC